MQTIITTFVILIFKCYPVQLFLCVFPSTLESPDPAHHGEHEFQSISINKAGISWEYKSQLVTSRLSTALTGLLQPGLTDTAGDMPPLQSDFATWKAVGEFFNQWDFYKCTREWMGWAREMGWSFKGPLQPQLLQEAAALSVAGIPFLLFPLLTRITQSSCVDILWHKLN